MTKIAIGLITCERAEYTRRTLESFTAQHPTARGEFVLLHADDQSTDAAIVPMAEAHGFTRINASGPRLGARAMRTALVRAAADAGAEWIVLLENDWEWARPFPWALLEFLISTQPDVYCLRLFGQWKERGQRAPCMRAHYGLPGKPATTWRLVEGAPEPVELGRIHWGAPPAATRIAEALILHADTFTSPAAAAVHAQARRRGDMRSDTPEMIESGRLPGRIARVVDNVVFHIGFKASARRQVVRGRPPRAARAPLYTTTWQTSRAWTEPHSARCLSLAFAALGLPDSLLDVGCGSGHLVTRARAMGIDAAGVDLSISGTDAGLSPADLRQPLALGRQYDAVLCWEVAEHLPASAADVLVGSLAAHLAPGGVLLFTAARVGQGGQGHINEQPPAYWADKLRAAGLVSDNDLTAQLAAAWRREAPRTPWYGANLQVFRAPGEGARFRPIVGAPPLRIAITMRTADRSPNPNYVGGTIRRLVDQGVDPASIHLCPTNDRVAWLERALDAVGVAGVRLEVPAGDRTPNENGLAQIACIDPSSADWILLLEDDLVFCADFMGSVERWLRDWARPDRHLYRLFGFRVTPPRRELGYAYDDATVARYAGSQAVALRMDDAQDFLVWARANLETWGGFRGNVKIAFDKLLAAWLLAQWPERPPVVSHPLFVKHIGAQSSLHPKTAHMDALFAGKSWRYAGREAEVRA